MPTTIDTVEEFWTAAEVDNASRSADGESIDRFRAVLGSYVGAQANELVELVPSARFGLEMVLRQNLDNRRKVLVPAFNCGAIEEAIRSAGGMPVLYDFSSTPGKFNWDDVLKRVDHEVRAIIITHYFGVPVDFRDVIRFCKRNDILIIEDCAHTFGGWIGGARAGTLGDVGLFSFNYDKPISLGWGGLVLVNNRRYKNENSADGYIIYPQRNQETQLLQDFQRAMAVRRRNIPRQQRLDYRCLRLLGAGRGARFIKAHNVGIGSIQAELGLYCLMKYPAVLNIRNDHAEKVLAHFPDRAWFVGGDVTPAWLKQKVRFHDAMSMRRISRQLQRKGIRVGKFNWSRLLNDESGEQFPTAWDAATFWMDIPIHQNMDSSVLSTMLADKLCG